MPCKYMKVPIGKTGKFRMQAYVEDKTGKRTFIKDPKKKGKLKEPKKGKAKKKGGNPTMTRKYRRALTPVSTVLGVMAGIREITKGSWFPRWAPVLDPIRIGIKGWTKTKDHTLGAAGSMVIAGPAVGYVASELEIPSPRLGRFRIWGKR